MCLELAGGEGGGGGKDRPTDRGASSRPFFGAVAGNTPARCAVDQARVSRDVGVTFSTLPHILAHTASGVRGRAVSKAISVSLSHSLSIFSFLLLTLLRVVSIVPFLSQYVSFCLFTTPEEKNIF